MQDQKKEEPDEINDAGTLVAILKTLRLRIEIQNESEDKIQFFAYLKDTGEYAAKAELELDTRFYGKTGRVSYDVALTRAGNGFATELLRAVIAYAYSDLGLVSLSGVAAENNLADQYILQRTGFVFNDKLEDDQLLFEAWNPRFQTLRE